MSNNASNLTTWLQTDVQTSEWTGGLLKLLAQLKLNFFPRIMKSFVKLIFMQNLGPLSDFGKKGSNTEFYKEKKQIKFCGQKCFWAQNFIPEPEFFWAQMFWMSNFIGPKICFEPKIFLDQKFFCLFLSKFFSDLKFFFDPNFFPNPWFVWDLETSTGDKALSSWTL